MTGGRIRDEAIREVRERASLVEVVSEVVALRRRGRTAVGLCPFHGEKTPSFTVSEERGFYHCFGCGEHGDVFAFVMKTQGLAFPEAVRRVAERFGIPLPASVPSTGRPTEPLTAANAAAAAFFRAELAGATGARTRAYLAERGVGAEAVARFGLGHAPAGPDALVRHLRAVGVGVEDALAAGLVMRRERPDGSAALIDRFRDRLMFPIADPSGRVIAFGGRILPGHPATATGDPPPKYLNSPESAVFHKGQTVYGLGQAREAIRRRGRAVVVEGYLDVIALAEAGVEEAVAPLGTALTPDQLRVLRRLTETVIACFDGDPAGRRAAARSFPVFLEAGLWGRGAFLPAGDDPDSFVRARGRDALETCLAGAAPLVEAYVEHLAGSDPTAVGRRTDAAREVERVLRLVRHPVQRDVLARVAADYLGVREELLRGGASPEPPPATAPAAHAPNAEQSLVELMAADTALARRVIDANVVPDFEDAACRRAAEAIAARGDDVDATDLAQSFSPELRDRVLRRLLGEIHEGDPEQELANCIARIRARALRRSRWQQLKDEVRAAEARGDHAAAATAIRELNALRAELSESPAAPIDKDRT